MKVDRLEVSAYTIPTEEPETDGTLTWHETTVVVVEPTAGDVSGLGFTYATPACVALIGDLLHDRIVGRDVMDVAASWSAMVASIRNVGRPGVASMAIAAVDTALWDLKARVLGLPLSHLLGEVRTDVPIYGSGGFTSYSGRRLADQLASWVHEDGIGMVKMKVGRDPDADLGRVDLALDAIGSGAQLMVDANGAYSTKQAIRLGKAFAQRGVIWFEEPVSSDDLDGLARVREQLDLDVAAGEYGYDLPYFERMAAAMSVDVLQVDVSRCAGITEWLRVAAVAAAHGLDVSGHCAQSLHAHPGCSIGNLRHLEYFHDHALVDRILFDGVLEPTGGSLTPDRCRPGIGLDLKHQDAERHRCG